MKLVVLGLSLSSAWGNGHATTYRALLRAFAARGHEILFLERDVPWYADHRDLQAPSFCQLALYPDLDALPAWQPQIEAADAVIVGSYVPDGIAVADWVLHHARGLVAFYDIDTPVTLAALERGDASYIAASQIPKYDIYLSFTGGPTLDRLRQRYGARRAAALFCSADPALYHPLPLPSRWDLSYLGTYSPDRQPTLKRLLIEPARQRPDRRFMVAGAQFPADVEWPANVERVEHLPPPDHPAFYAQSRFTLNVTRRDMIEAGYSPSVRLFEAGACGTAIISDRWAGLETIFGPGEIVIADSSDDVLTALDGHADRAAIAEGCHRRIMAAHTAAHRAAELEAFCRGSDPSL